MSTNIILVIASLISCLLFIYLLNYFLHLRIKGRIANNEDPLALNILRSVLFFSCGILLGEIPSSFLSLVKILPAQTTSDQLLTTYIMYYSIEVGIVFCVIVLSIWLSSIMYSVISKGKSVFLESITNNIGAVLIFSGVYLAMIFAAKLVVVAIFDSLIPYPALTNYH